MSSVILIALVLALVCELLAALSVPAPPRISWMPLGWVFYFLTLIPGLLH